MNPFGIVLGISFLLLGGVFFILGSRMVFFSFQALITRNINKEATYLKRITEQSLTLMPRFDQAFNPLNVKKYNIIFKLFEVLYIFLGLFLMAVGFALFTSLPFWLNLKY